MQLYGVTYMCAVDVYPVSVYVKLGEPDALAAHPVAVVDAVRMPIQRKAVLPSLQYRVLGEEAHATAKHATGTQHYRSISSWVS